MSTATIEERVQKLEQGIKAIQEQLTQQSANTLGEQRGWQWFVGIDADNPHFDEAARLGREWRYSDRPKEDENA